MEKEFASIFEDNNDISLNEYDINKLIEKTMEINENEFPVISIGNTDKDSPKIKGKVTSKEYQNDPEAHEVNINDYIKEEQENELEAYTDEENKKYKTLEESLSLSENDIEVADHIVESELDMSSLFANPITTVDSNNEESSENKEGDNTEGTEQKELSDEQTYIMEHIYSKEQDDILKESEEESLKEDELNVLESVDDFKLEDSFNNKNPLDDEEGESENSDKLYMKEYTDEELLDINNIENDEDTAGNQSSSDEAISNSDSESEKTEESELESKNEFPSLEEALSNEELSDLEEGLEELDNLQEESTTEETSTSEEPVSEHKEEPAAEHKEYTDEELLDSSLIEEEPETEVSEESSSISEAPAEETSENKEEVLSDDNLSNEELSNLEEGLEELDDLQEESTTEETSTSEEPAAEHKEYTDEIIRFKFNRRRTRN